MSNITSGPAAKAAFRDRSNAAPTQIMAGQVIEDHPDSGVVKTAFGYRDRDRVPEFKANTRSPGF